MTGTGLRTFQISVLEHYRTVGTYVAEVQSLPQTTSTGLTAKTLLRSISASSELFRIAAFTRFGYEIA